MSKAAFRNYVEREFNLFIRYSVRLSRRHSRCKVLFTLCITECNIFSNTFVFYSENAVERNALYKYPRRVKLLERPQKYELLGHASTSY